MNDYETMRILYKKHKALIGERKSLKTFNQPVLILIRKNKRVDFIEGVNKGEFKYEKSDGTQGMLELDPQFLLTFPYGETIFHGYIAYEEELYPLPQKPVAYAEQIGGAIQKVMNDKQKYKEGIYSDKGTMWLKLGKAVGIVILAVLGGLLAFGIFGVPLPSFLGGPEEAIKQTAVQTATNITVFP